MRVLSAIRSRAARDRAPVPAASPRRAVGTAREPAPARAGCPRPAADRERVRLGSSCRASLALPTTLPALSGVTITVSCTGRRARRILSSALASRSARSSSRRFVSSSMSTSRCRASGSSPDRRPTPPRPTPGRPDRVDRIESSRDRDRERATVLQAARHTSAAVAARARPSRPGGRSAGATHLRAAGRLESPARGCREEQEDDAQHPSPRREEAIDWPTPRSRDRG